MPKASLKNDKFFLDRVKSGHLIVHKSGKVINTKTNKKSNVVGNRQASTNGYCWVYGTAGPGSKRRAIGTHRLVWLAFKGPIPFGLEVNHKNGVKSDNRLSNLELLTPSKNVKHSYDMLDHVRLVGTNSPRSKLTDQQILYIRRKSNAISADRLAEKFGVSRVTIYNVINRKRYANIA